MTVAGSDADLAWLAGELSAIRRELLPAGESRALTLALDQGGTSSRAVLFDARGREVSAAHVPIDTQRPAADRVEHDAPPFATRANRRWSPAARSSRRASRRNAPRSAAGTGRMARR
jgi:hypothetical protein